MLGIRATFRCSATAAHITRNAINSVKLLHKNHSVIGHISPTAVRRIVGKFHSELQPVFLTGAISHKRHFTSSTADDNDLQRIYYGSLASRMRAVKVFSLTTSLAGLFAQPILLEQGMKLGGTGMAVALCGFGGFFTFITPLLLHFITKKYVTEIHYNPKTNEYVATTISILLWKIKTKFRPADVTVPQVPGMFTSFVVDKRPLFVDPALFDDPEHYVRIMGYDKPIDFKLDMSGPERSAEGDNLKSK